MATDFVSELEDAAASNDVDRIKAVLRRARASKMFDHSLLQAGLFESARHGCEDAARHLLSESAGFIAAGASMLDLPFLAAVQRDHVPIAGLMLDAGANPRTIREDGWSALHIACWTGSLEMVNLLLGANAHFNIRTRDGRTPLALAVHRGDEQVVRALVKQKGISMRDPAGNHIFFSAGRSNIMELLAPQNCAEALSSEATRACQGVRVRFTDCFGLDVRESCWSGTVYDLLYGHATVSPHVGNENDDGDDDAHQLAFRWIHFPVNNPAWIEATLIKLFLEARGQNAESFTGLVSSLNHYHQGQYPHSRFHQPACQAHGENIWVSMPYLHYETVSNFQEMQDAIYGAAKSAAPDAQPKDLPSDNTLIKAYMFPAGEGVHPRRTLDQFFYPNFDTRLRDRDQVVYRYQKTTGIGSDDPKLYMVDQLWVLIIGSKLVITSFPEQRNREPCLRELLPPEDQLNILDVISHIISGVGVRDIPEFVTQLTGRCCGIFDRHVPSNEAYRFLSMFEASIGIAAGREAELSAELWRASSQASSWLKNNSQRSREQNPEFLDKFLDFGPETRLLAEAKDIRDELNMLSAVLDAQKLVLAQLGPRLLEVCGPPTSMDDAVPVTRRFEEQLQLVDLHLQDLGRLDRQAAYVYDSASRLLDLKQKHANPFEARLAREQAAGAARTGKSVMIFTIVTIIFLPISFITSFFTIEIAEFPREEGSNALQLSFVMKYIFGVGFAVSIPLILVAFAAQDWSLGFRTFHERFQDWRKLAMPPAPPASPAAPAPIEKPEALSV
ncbi:hypothetical protein BJY00DRAFT_310609 [Aspergillus carlsbadensis]|nr:hypothetical protein BJY00DRAFT_310609 [Aspergillus carlsbadensis]